jgi:methylglutaconyl-CoA hydratase
VSKPTIAITHGGVYGGAVGLVSACDIAISTKTSRFALSEVRVGLSPSTIMPYILTRLNEHKAKWLMITGTGIEAETALKLGLIDFKFNENELEQNIQSIIDDILKGSPEAIAESKHLLKEVIHQPIKRKILNATIKSIAKMKKSVDGQEGMSSFIEKRNPAWMAD